jgi:hypothetical protein
MVENVVLKVVVVGFHKSRQSYMKS